MKITEVLKSNSQSLYESLDQTNDTGVLTEDLVKVVETHRADDWSPALTLEESIEMDRLIAEGKFPQ